MCGPLFYVKWAPKSVSTFLTLAALGESLVCACLIGSASPLNDKSAKFAASTNMASLGACVNACLRDLFVRMLLCLVGGRRQPPTCELFALVRDRVIYRERLVGPKKRTEPPSLSPAAALPPRFCDIAQRAKTHTHEHAQLQKYVGALA